MNNFPCNSGHGCPYKDTYGGCLSHICADRCGQHGRMHPRIAYECIPCTVDSSDGKNKHRTYWSIASAIANTRHWNPEKGSYSYTVKGTDGRVLYSGSFCGEEVAYQHFDFVDDDGFVRFDPIRR